MRMLLTWLTCALLAVMGPTVGWSDDEAPGPKGPDKKAEGKPAGKKRGGPPGGGRPPSPVVLGLVKLQDVKESRPFTGSVEAERVVEVDAEASGFVETLQVELGDLVEADAPIATLKTTTLDLRIKVAEAQRDLHNEELLELQNGSRPEELEQATAQVAERKAQVERAAFVLAANRKLYADKRISSDELQQSASEHVAAQARLAAAEANLKLVKAGPRAEDIAQAKARIAIQTAEIARLEDEKKRHEIKAPFRGFVTAKHVEKGAWLETGGAVVSLAALDEVDVVVPVLEDFVGSLRVGMSFPLTIDALDTPVVTGRIHRIVPTADRRTRTVPVRIRVKNTIENGVPKIKMGMFVRVAFAVGRPTKSMTVPKDAVTLGGPQPMVFVVNKETMLAAPVPVTLGGAVEDRIVVSGPLQDGQSVVTRANERLFPPYPTPVREVR